MPRPIPQSLAESLPTPVEQMPSGDILRTLGGVGLPGDEAVARMAGNVGIGSERAVGWQAAHTALERTRGVLSLSGVSVPELDSPELSGVNWDNLLVGYGAYESLGMHPEVVISPEGAALRFWRGVFSNLRQWQDANHADAPHRLQNRPDGDGLWVHEDVQKNWDKLAKLGLGPRWQASVIPTTSKAVVLKVDHNGLGDKNKTPQALSDILAALPDNQLRHPSIESYLQLQANRLAAGEEPVDTYLDNLYHYSWLDGEFTVRQNNKDYQVAPRGRWNPAYGQVFLRWDFLDRRDDRLGVRPPVRGQDFES